MEKGNKWFDDLDWDMLVEGKLKAPYIPEDGSYMADSVIKSEVKKLVPISTVIEKTVSSFKKGITRTVSIDRHWDRDF